MCWGPQDSLQLWSSSGAAACNTLMAVIHYQGMCCPAALEEAQDKGCGRKAASKDLSAGEVTWDVFSSRNGLYKAYVKHCQQLPGC